MNSRNEKIKHYRSVEAYENRNTTKPEEQVPYDPNFHDNPICRYCGETERLTPISGGRYHCNACFNATSPTVGTEYHKPQLPIETLEKVKACYLEGLSILKTAEIVGVNRNTVKNRFKQWDERAEAQLKKAKGKTLFGWNVSDPFDEAWTVGDFEP